MTILKILNPHFSSHNLFYLFYCSLLQTFLSSRAIYVVVFNLCHDMDKPVPVEVNPGSGDVRQITSFQSPNLVAPGTVVVIRLVHTPQECKSNFASGESFAQVAMCSALAIHSCKTQILKSNFDLCFHKVWTSLSVGTYHSLIPFWKY